MMSLVPGLPPSHAADPWSADIIVPPLGLPSFKQNHWPAVNSMP